MRECTIGKRKRLREPHQRDTRRSVPLDPERKDHRQYLHKETPSISFCKRWRSPLATPDNTIMAYKFSRMSASCFMTLRKETSTKSASQHARVIGNQSHADTCQPSTVCFQILNNSDRTGRTHRPPNTLRSRHEWPTGPDADPQRCNTEGKLNTASQQATTHEDLKQYRNKIHARSRLASKRR